MNGVELLPGFFNLYNERTSQSKTVLLHLESGYIFKRTYGYERWTASGTYLGEVTWDDITYRIRLPRFYMFGDVTAQEYIDGEWHDCPQHVASCAHTWELSQVTGYSDCHVGNWQVFNGEIVLFDFD
jgi:hypothetical protein